MRSVSSIQALLLLAVVHIVSSFTPIKANGRIFRMNRSSTLMRMSEEGSISNINDSSSGDVPEVVPKVSVKCPNCDLCDGSGRIIGGLGAIPLFSWWPIKAYRPCPNFIENGGQYVRSGQGLDEIAFGRDSSYNPE